MSERIEPIWDGGATLPWQTHRVCSIIWMRGFGGESGCVCGRNESKRKTRVKRLISLGVPKAKAYEWGKHVRNIGVLPAAQSYTKPSTLRIGNPEG